MALGITPQVLLKEFRWPNAGERIKSGEYDWYAGLPVPLLDELGSILHKLDEDITHNKATRA